MQCNCNAIFGVRDHCAFFISILELIVKKFLIWNQTKLLKDYLEVCLRIAFFVKMGLSLVLHQTGLTGKLCVCVRQNVAKRCNFLRIFYVPTFCQHFANMLMTYTTTLPIKYGFEKQSQMQSDHENLDPMNLMP